MQSTISRATRFMNFSQYDSAQVVISEAFEQTDFKLHDLDEYYLHCYEAEVMYYNALFEQGLNTAMRGLDLARQLDDPILIGNAENLIGLFMMGLDRHTEAIEHFHIAERLIPSEEQSSFLSLRYHALGNLGECLVRINQPDSAIFFSKQSSQLAAAANRIRGVALAGWNIAEAWLLKAQPDSAIFIGREALKLVSKSSHRDAVQALSGTLMKAFAAENQKDSAFYWMNKGFAENADPLNTDISRILFLQQSVELCLAFNDVERALEMVKSLYNLQRVVSGKQQTQRIAILKGYYLKNQNLILAEKKYEAQEKEIQLRNTISVILGFFVLVLAVLIYIYRMNSRQRQRIEQLQHEDQLRQTRQMMELASLRNRMAAVFGERNRIASDLHDDIGAALSSIRIYSAAAERQFESKPEESRQLITRIKTGSADMMDRMSDIIWSIHPENDTGQSLILRMKTFASEILGPQNMVMKFSVDGAIDRFVPSMNARRNVYLLFKEAVNNLAKYSGCTAALCSIEIKGDVFCLEISDNGKGFASSTTRVGNGLKTMNARAQSLGGHLVIHSALGLGTTIRLETPLANIRDNE